MSAGYLEEQHRETPADNRLKHHHKCSVKAPEFAEGGSHGRKARHIEQDEQQVGQHLETPQVEMRLHGLVRSFVPGTFGFINRILDAQRVRNRGKDFYQVRRDAHESFFHRRFQAKALVRGSFFLSRVGSSKRTGLPRFLSSGSAVRAFNRIQRIESTDNRFLRKESRKKRHRSGPVVAFDTEGLEHRRNHRTHGTQHRLFVVVVTETSICADRAHKAKHRHHNEHDLARTENEFLEAEPCVAEKVAHLGQMVRRQLHDERRFLAHENRMAQEQAVNQRNYDARQVNPEHERPRTFAEERRAK